ncbi:WG repeat-containing protein [Lutimaribacter marinistellae]|uniref:WG repeat-containing protein n=1 Tax=Lutimaribacter marinistellae TaxID=1820329 RepID=A0ABV7TML4_9RHOB
MSATRLGHRPSYHRRPEPEASCEQQCSGNGKWGFIDSDRNEVILAEFDFASGFRSGASAVNVDGWRKSTFRV